LVVWEIATGQRRAFNGGWLTKLNHFLPEALRK